MPTITQISILITPLRFSFLERIRNRENWTFLPSEKHTSRVKYAISKLTSDFQDFITPAILVFILLKWEIILIKRNRIDFWRYSLLLKQKEGYSFLMILNSYQILYPRADSAEEAEEKIEPFSTLVDQSIILQTCICAHYPWDITFMHFHNLNNINLFNSSACILMSCID